MSRKLTRKNLHIRICYSDSWTTPKNKRLRRRLQRVVANEYKQLGLNDAARGKRKLAYKI